MKKSIWIFLLAVLLPGFVLGWLALRSAEEQQIIFERRTAELYQKETEGLAASAREVVEMERRAFGDTVHRLLARSDAQALARDFTNSLMDAWPRKAIGFVLGPDGEMLSPTTSMAAKQPDLRDFLWNNGSFLCSTQPAVVYPVQIEANTKAATYGTFLKSRAGPASDAKPALSVAGGQEPTVLAQKGLAASQQQQRAFVKEPIPADSPATDTKAAEEQRKVKMEIRAQTIAQVPEIRPDAGEAANAVTLAGERVQRLADKALEAAAAAPMSPAPPVPAPVPVVQVPSSSPAEFSINAGVAVPAPTAVPALPPSAPSDPAPTAGRGLARDRVAEEKDALTFPAPATRGAKLDAAKSGDRVEDAPGGARQQVTRPAPQRMVTASNPSAVPPAGIAGGRAGVAQSRPSSASAPTPAAPAVRAEVKELEPAKPSAPAAPFADALVKQAKKEAPQQPGAPATGGESSIPEARGRQPVQEVELTMSAGKPGQSPGGGLSNEALKTAQAPMEARPLAANTQMFWAEQQEAAAANSAAYARLSQDNLNRMVEPQQQVRSPASNWSAILPATADFRALTAGNDEGMLARFVQDKLDLVFWIRPPEAPEMVFGCLIEAADLNQLWKDVFANRISEAPNERPAFVLALLDDKAKPVATFPAAVNGRDWKRPFVANEIGEMLPHWEAALYLATPTAVADTARGLRRTLSFTIAGAIALIAIGGWLVVHDVRRQLALAQQKTDFVSNVSHELKTPLTSIRMFAELMHDRPPPQEKQGQYLRIIQVEAERLTRLINNVLDFAKLERRQKRFDKKPLDLCSVITRVWEGQEMHLRDAGFTTRWQAAPGPYPVSGDEDAVAQILVNLLSNAEKYSQEQKDIELVTWIDGTWVNASILDRGIGVPDGEEKKIFEAFYRAHDSLSSGIQGSGLGLTLAQRVAREHGGEIVYERRQGGGSRFTFRMPLMQDDAADESSSVAQHRPD